MDFCFFHNISYSDDKAALKSFIISVTLIMLNVYVNWFVTFHLTTSQFLDTSLLSVDDFRIVIAVCQVAGSLLCLTIVDFIERKVNVMNVKNSKNINNQNYCFTIFEL